MHSLVWVGEGFWIRIGTGESASNPCNVKGAFSAFSFRFVNFFMTQCDTTMGYSLFFIYLWIPLTLATTSISTSYELVVCIVVVTDMAVDFFTAAGIVI